MTSAPHARALGLYGLVALAFNWPLPLDLSGSLTGVIGGDTGVYVWNQWLFRHEVVVHGRFPLFTREVLGLSPPVDLSLHNYTLFADLLAFPLIPVLGVAATFNVIYLALAVLTAWSMFVLARSVVQRTPEAWLAGALFGFSPVLIARGGEHFSLAAAAPLPIFLLLLRRADREGTRRDAAALGACAAWAAICDPYYGVFCVVMAAVYFAARHVRVRGSDAPRAGTRTIDVLIAVALGAVAGIGATGGTEFHAFGQRVAMRSLYTPVLLLIVLLVCRAWIRHRPAVALRMPPLRSAVGFAAVAMAAGVLLLSPVLFAFAYALADGGVLHGPTMWRSSPAGVDLLAFFTPNPNHSLFGEPWRDWLARRPNGYTENAASVTIVGVTVLAVAVWRYRFRPSRVWVVMTVVFSTLALGPFVYVGGVNTYVPGPWALLRYVPVVTATRMPGRYAIPAMMMFSLLFALALRHLSDRHGPRRPVLLALVTAALLFELTPFPRRLYSAHIPAIYSTIAKDPRNVRVLELPFGIRDGEWSHGNFTAASQFYQTRHEKALLGGYLSRISPRELERQRRSRTVNHLLKLSEGGELSTADHEELRRRAPGFVERARLGYVVIDIARTPAGLRDSAIEAFRLVKLGESDGRELYAPAIQLASAY